MESEDRSGELLTETTPPVWRQDDELCDGPVSARKWRFIDIEMIILIEIIELPLMAGTVRSLR